MLQYEAGTDGFGQWSTSDQSVLASTDQIVLKNVVLLSENTEIRLDQAWKYTLDCIGDTNIKIFSF